MLKFLRKYNKWILVVGGTLLMITFLVQPTLSKLQGDASARAIGSLDGKKISYGDQALATREINALLTWGQDVFGPGRALLRFILGLDKNVDQWILLVHEARQAGYAGEKLDGSDWIGVLAEGLTQQMYRGNSAEEFRRAVDELKAKLETSAVRAANEQRMTPEEFSAALGKARGVWRLKQSYHSAARLSDRRARAVVREMRDEAFADSLFIPAALTAGGVPAPTAEELEAHFQKYRAVAPGTGEYGIGYRQPARIKLEWLTLSRAAIERAITLDDVAVNVRWRENREKYRGDFRTERPNIERDMRAELAERALQEAQLVIQAEAAKTLRRLPGEGRFRKLPPDWEQQRPRPEAVAQAVQQQLKSSMQLSVPLPAVTTRSADWTTVNTLLLLPGLGSARLKQGGQTVPLAEALFSVRELTNSPTAAFQVGVPMTESYFIEERSQDRHYVTILAAKPEGPAESLDEVRQTAADDLKRIKAYQAVITRTEELRSLAAAQGLQAVADLLDPPKPLRPPMADPPPRELSVVKRVAYRRDEAGYFSAGGGSTDVFNSPALRAAVRAAADKIDPAKPAEAIDPAAATVAAPAPERLGLAIARIVGLKPFTREDFRAASLRYVMEASAAELTAGSKLRSDPFSLERLRARHTLKWLREQEDEESPKAPPVSGESGKTEPPPIVPNG